MTVEQKAKAYDEALNKIKPLYEQAKKDGNPIWSTYEYLIPELSESKDERIRKALIETVKSIYAGDAMFLSEQQRDRYLAWLEKQKEQKPMESISQLTVQGKGIYKICPRCKERMVRDDSMVYTSMPPQYIYECPKCGERECDTIMYDNPEMEEQKQEWSEEDEKMRNLAIEWAEIMSDKFSFADMDPTDFRKIISFLKSLRPSWKPSEEQMKALKNISYGFYQNGDGPFLRELYEQLKKLM